MARNEIGHPDFSEDSINSGSEENLLISERASRKSVTFYNVLFGFLVVAGQTSQNVVLPLFIDSGRKREWDGSEARNNSNNSTRRYEPFMDNFFVSLFTSFCFAVLFGVSFAFKNLYLLFTSGKMNDRKIPRMLVVLVGFLSAASGVLIVFSSSGKRTAPYLQALLINITIPTTLVLRYCLLKKSPTRKKLFCALATLLSLFVCLLPSIFPEIDPKHKTDKEQGGAKGLAGILWPLCFMSGFVFSAVSYVAQEKLLQSQHATSQEKVDLLYIMFLIELFQFLFILPLFWLDAIPSFGNVESIEHVFLNFSFSLKCFFGYAGCSLYPALYGSLFVLSFICYFTGAACLLRYSEGATYLAIVSSMVTPAGFMFWTFFKEQPSFHWHPEVSVTVWLNIAGLVVMVPSIYVYNSTGTQQTPKGKDLDTDPLLNESSFANS